MRAVIYARYSTDMQREASIEDQIRVCTALAERLGVAVEHVYADYAISGTKADRPQFLALHAEIARGGVDVVLAESLDRLSRDQEHIAGLFKQTSFRGVKLITVAEGEVSEIHIGLKGTMNALFLKDLGLKTHRGLEGRVAAGRSAGGLSFGYRVSKRFGADGAPVTGEMEIERNEAALVRRVFAAYIGGQSPRSIAKTLNADGVPGPRGGKWTASLLLGNATRETGILRNSLYVGERVWNRQHYSRDPNTGKRISRPNPPDAWKRASVPALRIIDDPTWSATKARLAAARQTVLETRDNLGSSLGEARRPVWLLASLVRCGSCDGPLTVIGKNGRLGCANHVERGTCDNPRSILRGKLVDRVMLGLKHRLLAPELVEVFVAEFTATINAANRDRAGRDAQLERQHAALKRQIRSFLDLMKNGMGTPAMVEELRGIETKERQLREQMAASKPEPAPVLMPNLGEVYRRKVEKLEEALREPETFAAATAALRGLIDAIVVTPGAKRGEVSVTLRGDLAAFMHLAEDRFPASANGSGYGVMGSLVAGTRNPRYLRLFELVVS